MENIHTDVRVSRVNSPKSEQIWSTLVEKLVPVSKMVIFNPKSDQHLISPNSKMAVSFIKIMRVKEMITTQRSFDC